jgi:hypothetical protein
MDLSFRDCRLLHPNCTISYKFLPSRLLIGTPGIMFPVDASTLTYYIMSENIGDYQTTVQTVA